jgi:hypothetical protein
MVYRYQLSKNPRSILFPAVAVLLVGGSIAVVLTVDRVVGVIALVVSAIIGYYFVNMFRKSLASVIRLTDDGISAVSPMGANYSLEWGQITIAGVYSMPGKSPELFVYAEDNDRLFRIPDTYSNFDEMEDELRRYVGEVVALSGSEPEDLIGAIKDRLSV